MVTPHPWLVYLAPLNTVGGWTLLLRSNARKHHSL